MMRPQEFKDMDPLFEAAAQFAVDSGTFSMPDLRDILRVGAGRAELLISQLCSAGIIGPADGELSYIALIHGLEDVGLTYDGDLYADEDDYDDEELELTQPPCNSSDKVATKESIDAGHGSGNNTATGCLGYCLDVFSYTMLILMLILLAPAIIFGVLVWWIVALILGLFFPGKDFFPVKKVWKSVSAWFEKHLGVDLEFAAISAVFVVLAASLIDGISSLFGGSSKE